MTEAFQKLGRYLLTEEIASGGMAVVYRGKLIGVDGFEKDFAIKKILPTWSDNPDFVRMLVNEAKVLVPLRHDNIVQVFELGKDQNSHFLVMEYVEGFDLKRILKRLHEKKRDMPLKLFCYVATEICHGLEFVHSRKNADGRPLGLVHRDISPQNILVSVDGHVKITDFGIAKIPGKSLETQAGLLKGKFSYMSPEQAMGLAVDEQTDVFALGTVLFEMITGKKAFDGENDFVIWEKVKTATVSWPPDLNPELKKILAKALDADKSKRYATTRDLRRDIEKIANSLPDRAEAFDLKLHLVSLFGDEIRSQVEHTRELTVKTRLLPTPTSEHSLEPTLLHEATIQDQVPSILQNQSDSESLPPLNGSRIAFQKQIVIALFALLVVAVFIYFGKAPLTTPTIVIPNASQGTSPTTPSPSLVPSLSQNSPEPAVRQPSPVFAKLVLKTVPEGATIEIQDGSKTRTTTGFLNEEFELKSKTLSVAVTVSAKGFHAQKLNFEFSKNKRSIDETISLKAFETGTIRIVEARPWGTANIRGYGQKTVPATFKVTEGTHTVTVTMQTPTGVKSVSRTLSVEPKSNIRCIASFASHATLSCR